MSKKPSTYDLGKEIDNLGDQLILRIEQFMNELATRLGEASAVIDQIGSESPATMLAVERTVANQGRYFDKFISGRWKRRDGTVYGKSREEGIAEYHSRDNGTPGSL